MKTKTIHKVGHKAITFHPGGLHQSTHTKAGTPISAVKFQKALSGGYGAKAKKQAEFKKNILTGRKKK